MNYKEVTLKKFLKALRKKPSKALEILKHRPDFAVAVWQGGNKWIPGSTPLHWAAHDGRLKLVEKLIEFGADINANEADWWSRPIDWAADSGQFKVIQYLLENDADFGGDKWSNCTPLHAAAQGGSTNGKENAADYKKTAEVLINGGADVNAVATYGGQPPKLTPLDDAQRVGNKAVEEVLIKYGGKNGSDLS